MKCVVVMESRRRRRDEFARAARKEIAAIGVELRERLRFPEERGCRAMLDVIASDSLARRPAPWSDTPQ